MFQEYEKNAKRSQGKKCFQLATEFSTSQILPKFKSCKQTAHFLTKRKKNKMKITVFDGKKSFLAFSITNFKYDFITKLFQNEMKYESLVLLRDSHQIHPIQLQHKSTLRRFWNFTEFKNIFYPKGFAIILKDQWYQEI